MRKQVEDKSIPKDFEQSVDSKTAAAFLKMNHKTLERKARYREVPASRQGRHWQFLLSLLDEWRRNQMNANVKPNNGKKENDSQK